MTLKNRVSAGLAHGLSRQNFLLPFEKYSTATGLFQNSEEDGWPAGSSEAEGETGADAALVLGEDQQGTVAQQIRTVALCKQVAHIQHRLEAA